MKEYIGQNRDFGGIMDIKKCSKIDELEFKDIREKHYFGGMKRMIHLLSMIQRKK